MTGIEIERERIAKEWLFVPALVVLGGVALAQRRRAAAPPPRLAGDLAA